MINIVMLVANRPRLTEQAIRSLIDHTTSRYRLLIVDDYSASETADMLDEYAEANQQTIRVAHSRIARLGPGLARNIGIKKADQWGRGDLLYLCDNDCYFLPRWDENLLAAWEITKKVDFKALGGYCHPFQQRGRLSGLAALPGDSDSPGKVYETEALGLLSWLMDWSTWDKFGNFDAAARINGSEDWEYSQRIRNAGGKVGVLEPPVVVNCGVTGSDGKPCPGARLLYDQDAPPGVIFE